MEACIVQTLVHKQTSEWDLGETWVGSVWLWTIVPDGEGLEDDHDGK